MHSWKYFSLSFDRTICFKPAISIPLGYFHLPPPPSYQYAVSRSLEGSYATSKGIVSTPDLGQIDLRQVLTEREHVSLALASDGLFEVIDNEELSRELVIMRDSGVSAKDAAKTIVSRALKKGTSDNVSVVIIYFS